MTSQATSHPLRGRSRLTQALEFPIVEQAPPRTLTSLARIIDGGLCHRCGSCVGICPTSVLGTDEEEYPIVNNLNSCTDCDWCVKVCPGAEFEAEKYAKEKFGLVPKLEDMHGHFEAAYLSHASSEEIRQASTSGGFVTALLAHLLKSKQIDGAIVIGSDEKDLWKGKPFIARTEEEIFSATKSKYVISPTNKVFAEVTSTPGRYAFVGLPCQVHGLLKAQELNKTLKERIVLSISLFCHAAVEHEALKIVWEKTEASTDKPIKKFISRIGKHPGTPHVELDDKTLKPVYFPKKSGFRPNSMEILNIMYRLYTPKRCLTCYDSTGEFADIAVGDPWFPSPSKEINFKNGYSFVLARTKIGIEALKAAQKDGYLSNTEVSRAIAKTSNTMMGEEKRGRAFRVIKTHERQGRSIPNYGFKIPSLHVLKTEMNMLSHTFCFINRGKSFMLRTALSEFGYWLLWLNNKKRRFRSWRKELLANYRQR